MEHDLDLLEQRLLKLGQEELALETKIRELQTFSREEGRAGHFEQADAAWALREQLVVVLARVQTEIMQIERVLYSARTRKR